MFDPLPLTNETPRSALPATLWLTDLMPQLIFAGLMLFLSIAGLLATRSLMPGWGATLFFVLLAAGAGYAGYSIWQRGLQRQHIYQHGTLVSAQVQRHGRTFHPLKSSRDYAVWLTTQGPAPATVKLTSPRPELWEVAPQGATLTGLTYQKTHLFAEAVGRRFVVGVD